MLASLPRPGFLMKNDMNWRVLFEDKIIRKRIVSSHKLRKFYRSPDLHLDLERHMGVITAIQFISGGLTFEGDALQATNEAFNTDGIDEGWHCSVTDAREQSLSRTKIRWSGSLQSNTEMWPSTRKTPNRECFD
ncbi:hypothetical protein MHU86_9952 [Fragilaria crotonensis]|nr:hypothetical protein MHU86_9952 [Fragilaria crotonensis]